MKVIYIRGLIVGIGCTDYAKMAVQIPDEVRDVMRLHHYSIHTERTYTEWIKQFIGFHKMRSRDDLADGEQKIEAFLTHLAVNRKVIRNNHSTLLFCICFINACYTEDISAQ